MNPQDHKQALPPGFRLGSYHVVRVLGAGGFGVTYLCEHGGLGVTVAVKEYLPNDIAVRSGNAVTPKSTADQEGYQWGLSRFLDEARTLARFEHRNVVRVRDFFEANGTAYIVMDYEDGEPLDRVLERTGTLTEAQIKRLLLPIVAGLRQMHAAGFLHRDVKPANIFIRRSDESPVLLDFGSARQALGRLSRSVTAIASSGYSPPEQYESNGEHGPWTDIYALSALCYRAITGMVPVEATRRQSRLLRGEDDPLPRLADIARGRCSHAFLAAVDHGLRVVERERPQSLEEWWLELGGSAHNAAKPPDADAPLRGASEHGNVDAQFGLGRMHHEGDGVVSDKRPWWMNILSAICLYMTFIYLPSDLFLTPVAEDEEVWFGFVLHGWAAKLTAPLHWLIYAAGTYGFWTMARWMWPWAALYMAQIALAMLVWNVTDERGLGWFAGLVSAAIVALPAIALWLAKGRFHPSKAISDESMPTARGFSRPLKKNTQRPKPRSRAARLFPGVAVVLLLVGLVVQAIALWELAPIYVLLRRPSFPVPRDAILAVYGLLVLPGTTAAALVLLRQWSRKQRQVVTLLLTGVAVQVVALLALAAIFDSERRWTLSGLSSYSGVDPSSVYGLFALPSAATVAIALVLLQWLPWRSSATRKSRNQR